MEPVSVCCRDQKTDDTAKAAKGHGAESAAQAKQGSDVGNGRVAESAAQAEEGVDAGAEQDARSRAEKEGFKDRVKASLAKMHDRGPTNGEDRVDQPGREAENGKEGRVRPCHQALILERILSTIYTCFLERDA